MNCLSAVIITQFDKLYKATKGHKMKIVIILSALAASGAAMAFGTDEPRYECKVDPRGVLICYPKPRGF